MITKKNLTNMVLVGALALGVSGCRMEDKYDYNGNIGAEYVKIEHSFPSDSNTLEVKRANGAVIEYRALRYNSQVHRVTITKDGTSTAYYSDDIGKKVIEEGQVQYDSYLAKILELKQAKGLNDISAREVENR